MSSVDLCFNNKPSHSQNYICFGLLLYLPVPIFMIYSCILWKGIPFVCFDSSTFKLQKKENKRRRFLWKEHKGTTFILDVFILSGAYKTDPDQKGKGQYTVGENSQYFKWLIICNSQSCLKVTCLLCLVSTVLNRENTVNCTTRKKNTFRFLKALLAPGMASQTRLIASLKRQKKALWQKNVWVSSLRLKCTGENSFDCISVHKWG